MNYDAEHYVYRCYDAADRLLYIGATRDVDGRLYHLASLCNTGKGPGGELRRRMVRHAVEAFPDRRSAFDAERAAIRAERPELNIQSLPSEAS